VDRNQEIQLVRRAQRGDRAAAGELVRAFQGGLYLFLLRISGRPELAEDATQEALIRGLTSLERFDERYRFSTWIYTIGKRVLYGLQEKKAPATGNAAVDDAIERAQARVHEWEELSRQDERGALARALLRLPEMQREIVVLFHQQEWPIARIAEALDIPEGTVKSHLHRGRVALRGLLNAWWRGGCAAGQGGEVRVLARGSSPAHGPLPGSGGSSWGGKR
jgi:RNA polymerase sigma-70 factor (ECF subfamily)